MLPCNRLCGVYLEETFVSRRDQLGKKAEKKEDGKGRGRGRSAARGSGGCGRGRGRGADIHANKETADKPEAAHEEPKPKRRQRQKGPAAEQNKSSGSGRLPVKPDTKAAEVAEQLDDPPKTPKRQKREVVEEVAEEPKERPKVPKRQKQEVVEEVAEKPKVPKRQKQEVVEEVAEKAKVPKRQKRQVVEEKPDAPEAPEAPAPQDKKNGKKKAAKRAEANQEPELEDEHAEAPEARGAGFQRPRRSRQNARQLDHNLADAPIPQKLDRFVMEMEAFAGRFEPDWEFDEVKAKILRLLKKWRNREFAYTTLTNYWKRPATTVRVWVDQSWKDFFPFSFAKDVAPMWLRLALTVCCGWLLAAWSGECFVSFRAFFIGFHKLAAGCQHRVLRAGGGQGRALSRHGSHVR